MIQSFKHKGLQNFFETGSKKGIQPDHAKKLPLLLGALNVASHPFDMNRDGWGFHAMKHWGPDFYSVKVNGNWRVTFHFTNGNANIVDYLDYH
jgi:proteic killer suppression protein